MKQVKYCGLPQKPTSRLLQDGEQFTVRALGGESIVVSNADNELLLEQVD